MSIKLMNAVWDCKEVSGTDKLVYLALADQANDQGVCWPSQATIARRASISRRYVNTILDKLAEAGYIERQKRFSTSTLYRVFDPAHVNPSSHPCESYITPHVNYDSHPCEPQFTPHVNHSSQEPPINHQLTTSESPDNHSDDWQIQIIAERMTGLMCLPSDIATLKKWETDGVTEADISAALAWRQENVKRPVKRIAELAGGVETSRLQRIQAQNPYAKAKDRNVLGL